MLEKLCLRPPLPAVPGKAANREDLNFHLSIAAVSQNQTLSKILELLLTDNNAYVEFSGPARLSATPR